MRASHPENNLHRLLACQRGRMGAQLSRARLRQQYRHRLRHHRYGEIARFQQSGDPRKDLSLDANDELRGFSPQKRFERRWAVQLIRL
jgi:hypothetical protein